MGSVELSNASHPPQLAEAQDRKARKAAQQTVSQAKGRLGKYEERLKELAATPGVPKVEVGSLEEVCLCRSVPCEFGMRISLCLWVAGLHEVVCVTHVSLSVSCLALKLIQTLHHIQRVMACCRNSSFNVAFGVCSLFSRM